MEHAMLSLDLRAYYRRRFYVRRRRLGSKIFLVHLTRVIEIDEISNDIWLECDGTKSALEVANAIACGHAELEKGRFGFLALYNMQFFLDQHLMEVLPCEKEGS
jgi:hypothetical protein